MASFSFKVKEAKGGHEIGSKFTSQYLKFATQFSFWVVNLLPNLKIDYSKYRAISLLSYFIFNLYLNLNCLFI